MGATFQVTSEVMRSIVAGICLLMVASAYADYYLSANQIFCNCGSTEAAFYQSYTNAENACSNQPHGSGYGSCLGVQMGLLSDDCRSQDVDAFKALLGDNTEAFDACNTGPMPAPMNATEGYQWAGAYPYQNLDIPFQFLCNVSKITLLETVCKRLWTL